MNSIQIKREFAAPIAEVFELLSKHENYNLAFSPAQVERIKVSTDPEHPDGVGSVRRIGYGAIKPLKEKITLFSPHHRIEYKIISNPLVKHHLGILQFETIDPNKTLLIYTIELQTRMPFVSKIILAQLKVAIKLGLLKLSKTL